MKRLTGIWRSALIMTLAMALIVVLFLLGILGYMVLTFKLNVDANFSTNTIDEALVQTADGYEFSAAYALDGKNQWAMLIDDSGDVIWSYHKPAEIPDHYTMRDVAAFTRWFIDDYPVRTRIRDDGLLVIGAPEFSLQRYSVEIPTNTITPTLFWFSGLFLVMLMGLSLWAERAGRRNRFAGEYFLGDRSLKGFVLAMTLVATYGSVSSFVSGPGLAWQLGLGWVVFAAPQIIAGFLILGVAGKKMAVVSRAAGALTVIDMIRARYGDGRGGRTLAALLAVLMLVFFTTMMIGQFIGGAQIFSKAAGVSYGWGLVLFGAVTVLYTAFGGFRAVAVTDTACAVLMLVGMGALGWKLLETGGGARTTDGRRTRPGDGERRRSSSPRGGQ